MSTQGWSIDLPGELIKFYEAPANGAAISVEERATNATGATSVFALGAWSPLFGYPSEVEYFSDRLFFAGSRTAPQTLWASKIGAYSDFGRSVPLVDDDSLTFTINARRLNRIQDLCALDNLLPLTGGGVWRMTAGSDDVVSPSTVGFKPQDYFGASKLPAQVVGNSAVYVQDKGQLVRDIAYSFTADGYEGGDLTAFAEHFVEGFELVDVAYSQSPYSVVWLVRNDGKLLSLTYMREQQVVGWAMHETDGAFEAVCCVPEGGEDATYVVVRRVVEGTERRYVERLASRLISDISESFFVDSGLTYDGRNTTSTTIALSGGTSWDEEEVLTVTASSAIFTGASDVGDVLQLRRTLLVDNEEFEVSVRVTIATFTSTTQVQVVPIGEVPVELRGTPTSQWTFARDTIGGLDHLEGREVAVLADGNVQDRKVVTGGQIALDLPGGIVHVGLPYEAMGETLDINIPGEQSVRNRQKLIRKVSMQVLGTRGLFAGPDRDHLDEVKQREFEDYTEPTEASGELFEIPTDARWDRNGRVMFVQRDPLPVTILSIVPDVMIGGSE